MAKKKKNKNKEKNKKVIYSFVTKTKSPALEKISAKKSTKCIASTVDAPCIPNNNTLASSSSSIKTQTSIDKSRKSKAKMAGVKSTFIADGRYIMTSFGRGNDAVIEHTIDINTHSCDSNRDPSFSVDEISTLTRNEDEHGKNILVTGFRNIKSNIYIKTELANDSLHLKSVLERKVFGANTEVNDNIHIQIIHNIFDIEKTLTFVTSNIVYTINNIARQPSDNDFLGNMHIFQEYETLNNRPKNKENYEKFLEKFSRYTNYLSNAFYVKNENKYSLREPKDIYNIIRTLSVVRNCIVHNMFSTDRNNNTQYNIYNIANNNNLSEIFSNNGLLDRIYAEKVNEINTKFLKKCKKDIAILASVLNTTADADIIKLVEEWYKFSILHANKNIGFSITRLREKIITNMTTELSDITNIEANKVRKQLYSYIDFAICRFYTNNQKDCEVLIRKLRASADDLAKDTIYTEEAEQINAELKRQIQKVSELRESTINEVSDIDINDTSIYTVRINSENTHWFSKLIYLLTLFLNGKEINELLTTLIHKFESITSFIKVINEVAINTTNEQMFDEAFTLFSESEKLSKELRIINSFALMNKERIVNPERDHYEDACTILGLRTTNDSVMSSYLGRDVYTYDEEMRKFIENNVLNSKKISLFDKICSA